MDTKLDDLSAKLDAETDRMRAIEIYMAKFNGFTRQRQWDAKSTMFVLMFLATLIGSLASLWKG